jgi:hypothetical protein
VCLCTFFLCACERLCVRMCKHVREYCKHQSVYSLSSGQKIQVELSEMTMNFFFDALQTVEPPEQCLSTIKRRERDADELLRSRFKIR